MKLNAAAIAFARSPGPARSSETTLWSESWQSIHSKPRGSKSSAWSAGSAAKRRFRSRTQSSRPACRGSVEQVPVEARVVVPLLPLPDLAAHEEQLLAGLGPHVREQQPQVGELLPVVARHLREQRALQVHDLVVRERQHEVLGVLVHPAERQLGVVELPDGRDRAPCSRACRSSSPGPTSCRSRGRRRTSAATPSATRSTPPRSSARRDGAPRTSSFSRRRSEIASRFSEPPYLLGIHSPALREIVEVEHRRHGVHPQPVDVVAVEPVERRRTAGSCAPRGARS